MAPSSFKKIGAAVACATAVTAATEAYQLSEEYTADNFFDKFDFFTSTYTSGDSWDDTHGYVHYRGLAEAESLGLISTSNGQVYIGPDANNTYDPDGTGRDSVRLRSKAMYNQGLMIAKFSHMPAQACGAWSAFWSFGSPWLTQGEIDYFEGWNEMDYNRMALHTNKTLAGECTLTTTGIEGSVMTDDCTDLEDGTGCSVKDASGVWSSTKGATFAMEWTDAAIKIWSWLPSAVPADITNGTPDPSSSAWGNPSLMVEQTNCDLGKSFANQQLVFDIDFCGDTAGSPKFWNETCSAKVGDSCANYVANNPAAFAETYFMVEGIQYYEMGSVAEVSVSVTASAALVSPTSTSNLAGLLAGAASVLESTLGATVLSTPKAAVTEAAVPDHHTTSYIYGTATSTDEFGSETTVVVVVDTTICPITAAEASASSAVLASGSGSSVVVAAQQTSPAALTSNPPAASPTPHSTLTSYSTSRSTKVEMTTSTIFSTFASTITSCASTASLCSVGDVTTVVVAVSTTICPVTAAEQSAATQNSPAHLTGHTGAPSLPSAAISGALSHSTGVSVPAFSGESATEISPVQAAGHTGTSPLASAVMSGTPSHSTDISVPPSSGESATEISPVQAAGHTGAPPRPSAMISGAPSYATDVSIPTSSGKSATEISPAQATGHTGATPPSSAAMSGAPSYFAGVSVPASSGKSATEISPAQVTAISGTSSSPFIPAFSGNSATEISPVQATAISGTSSSPFIPASSGNSATEISPVQATASSGTSSSLFFPASSGKSATEISPAQATASSGSSSSSSVLTSKSTLSTTTKSTLSAAAAASTSSTSSQADEVSATKPTTQVITATDTGGGLELATEEPTSLSIAWLTQATVAATAAAASSTNGTATDSSSPAGQSNTCSGMDCIVVSSGGNKADVVGGASGIALVVLAGAMFLF